MCKVRYHIIQQQNWCRGLLRSRGRPSSYQRQMLMQRLRFSGLAMKLAAHSLGSLKTSGSSHTRLPTLLV
ncbi:hypothetical protein FF1_011785 [Malus domestica]